MLSRFCWCLTFREEGDDDDTVEPETSRDGRARHLCDGARIFKTILNEQR